MQKLNRQTKAVIFDFDGTLTKERTTHSSWEKIWVELGYTPEDCRNLHEEFDKGNISHQEWCDITANKFRAKNLHHDLIEKIGDEIELMPGIEKVINDLLASNIKLYIVSGSIKTIIEKALGALHAHFIEVKANKFVFNEIKYLVEIIGTKYDFKGKAKYISKVIQENNLSPDDVVFIGNSVNDNWAHLSGVKTICINPRMKDKDYKEYWSHILSDVESLYDIMYLIE